MLPGAFWGCWGSYIQDSEGECIGFMRQGFGSSWAAGVNAVRKDQELTP